MLYLVNIFHLLQLRNYFQEILISDTLDQFRQSVGLRGYGQLNPLVEYQTAGYHMFEQMIADIEYETTRLFMKSEIRQNVTR